MTAQQIDVHGLPAKWCLDRPDDPHSDAWMLGYLRAKRQCANELEAVLRQSGEAVAVVMADGYPLWLRSWLESSDYRNLPAGTKLYTAPPATSGLVEARTLYVDLDGVMADFDGAFPQVFGLDHRSLADDEMWLRINGHPSFFRDLPPMAGAIEFFRSIEHLNPVILTACPKSNYARVAAQKRAWVREHLSATCWVLPVLGGRHKPIFMHRSGDVLIDDFGKNCAAWAEAGGIAIKHEGDWTSTRASLAAALAAHDARGGE